MLGPVPPVALLNPPIIRHTAALLAGERRVTYHPAPYVEGEDMGDATLGGALGRKLFAGARGGLQQLAVAATALPLPQPVPLREVAAAGLRRVLPEAGTGPPISTLRIGHGPLKRATGADDEVGVATMEGTGHPGYTATAAIIVEVALHMLDRSAPNRRAGCLPPTLVIGASVEALHVDALKLR